MRASVDLRHSPEVVYSNRAELGCLLPALANEAQVCMFGTPAIAPIPMTLSEQDQGDGFDFAGLWNNKLLARRN